MEIIVTGILIAIGFYLAPFVIGLGVVLVGGVIGILGSIFGGRR